MVLAHSFGQRYDLPIPLALFVLGGGLVVLLSFALVLRRTADTTAPAYDDEVPSAGTSPVGGAVALLVLAALVYAGLTGAQEIAENIVPTAFWLLVWIAVPLTCGLIGDWTRPVNPFAFLARLTDRPGLRKAVVAREQPLRWPLGWWLVPVLFFALACGELVFNQTTTQPRFIAVGLLIYAVVNAVAGLLFGAAWIERGEVFTVLFSTWGRLGWFRFGAPGRRGFTGGLRAPFDIAGGRIAFVLLLLVSVSFDGLLATPRWAAFERAHTSSGAGLDLLRLLSFAALAVVTAVAFGAFAYASARAGRHGDGPRTALAGLLPSMVPIAFAYLLAHNLQYLLVNGQLLGPLLGNPTGTHALGLPRPFNDTVDPNPTFLPSAFYWYVGVVVIVAAHVLAVVLAHRHLAARAQDEGLARRSEYPWLVAMVAYTMVSLTLIAQPLVQETKSSAQVGPTSPARPSAGAALEHRLDVAVDAAGQHRHGARAERAADADHLTAAALSRR
jgi:hypothetical protein